MVPSHGICQHHTSSISWLRLCPLMGSGNTHIPVGVSSTCCCTLLGPSRQCAPFIMHPNGSTGGKCQSRALEVCNVREAAHLASVSLLTLTEHVAKGSCPRCRTSTGESHTKQGVGKLDMNEFVKFSIVPHLKSHRSADSVGSCQISFQQKDPHRAHALSKHYCTLDSSAISFVCDVS